MLYREYKPAGLLSRYVSSFWYCSAPAMPHAQERVLPSGTTEIIIDLRRSDPMPDLVVGVHTGYITINTVELTDLIGIHFHPGGFSSPDFTNRETALELLWGRSSLKEQLIETDSIDERFRLLEQVLLKHYREPRRHSAIDYALSRFTASPNTTLITDIQKEAGMSPKRFISVFREEVGITPKLYCRIRRFRQVLDEANRGKHIRWADIAATCGYFDQSHFIRDFRAFSGLNPSEYLERRSAWPGHVPVATEVR